MITASNQTATGNYGSLSRVANTHLESMYLQAEKTFGPEKARQQCDTVASTIVHLPEDARDWVAQSVLQGYTANTTNTSPGSWPALKASKLIYGMKDPVVIFCNRLRKLPQRDLNQRGLQGLIIEVFKLGEGCRDNFEGPYFPIRANSRDPAIREKMREHATDPSNL